MRLSGDHLFRDRAGSVVIGVTKVVWRGGEGAAVLAALETRSLTSGLVGSAITRLQGLDLNPGPMGESLGSSLARYPYPGCLLCHGRLLRTPRRRADRRFIHAVEGAVEGNTCRRLGAQETLFFPTQSTNTYNFFVCLVV